MWVIYFKHKAGKEPRWNGGKENDRSGAGGEKHSAFCAGCLLAAKGLGQDISDHHVVLCKVRLVGTYIKRKEIVDGARRIRSEKLREHQYREGYARSLEGKRVKQAIVESAREVCDSVRVGGGNP